MAEMAHATARLARERPDGASLRPTLPLPSAPIPLALPESPAASTDTLIVSDLHLGLPDSRPLDLLDLLHSRPFGRLILLGDIFHDPSFRHLDGNAWRLLQHIRTLGAAADRELVWLHGNHDRKLGHAIGQLLGVAGHESFVWQEQGRRCVALHGDCFDAFISRHVRFGELCSAVYACCQRRLAPYHGWLSRLEAWQVRVAGVGEQVARRALEHGREAAFDLVVCGHTHQPLIKQVTHGGRPVTYANSGAWVGRPASFLTVGPHGLGLDFCH